MADVSVNMVEFYGVLDRQVDFKKEILYTDAVSTM